MKLYHFTSKYHIGDCKFFGLTLGCIPLSIDHPPVVINGYQWLTKNKQFKQSWCEYSTLPYNRNDYIITIVIPKAHRKNLLKWIPYGKQFKSYDALNSYGDLENWYVFKGTISTKWFRKINQNPRAVNDGS